MNRFFSTVVLAVCISVLFSGCNKEYMAEREFYKAEQLLKQVKLTEGAEALSPAAEGFQRVVDKYPSSKKALQSLELISNIRLKQKNYAAAREAMADIVRNFSTDTNRVADARFRIAQIYELEKNWDGANRTYWELAEFSPLNIKGLYAPIRVLTYYKNQGDVRELDKAYVRTLDHYIKLEKQIGPIDSVAPVKNYLAMAYMIKGDDDKALETWRQIYEQFPEHPYAPLAILASAELVWNRSGAEPAEALYRKFFEKYSKHPLAGKTAMTIGLLYSQQNNYEKARQWYQKALDEYFQDKSTERAEIKLLLGKTYQDEVMWAEADAIYQEIERDYDDSVAAMQIPLLRAHYHKTQGDLEKSEALISQALADYDNFVTLHEGDARADYAERFKAQALAELGAWDEVIKQIETRMDAEKTPERKGRWLFLKALLTQNRLEDPVQAAALYKEFLASYPDHPLAARAKSELSGLSVR